jgi:hypothetical protein
LAFVIVTIINFYVFGRMSGLLGLENRFAQLGFAFAMAVLLGVGFFVRTSTVKGTKSLFVVVTSIYGIELIALPALFCYEIVQLIVDVPTLLAGQVILIFVLVIAAVSLVNAQLLVIRKLKLPFARKLRVVHLTDVHIGAAHGRRYLARVVAIVNCLKPDLVLITGDIVSGAVAPGNSRLENFARLESPTYMVPGNHEYYEGVDEIRAALPENVVILRDEEVGFDGYSLFGLDFSQDQGISGARKIDRKFEKPTIAMAHVPQFLDLPAGSIILSGHYHAGQVFPINWLGRFAVKYFRGFYTENSITLYVAPGTATWGPPMRFGSSNEITLFELGPD